ncbi:MAG: hypothetical protein N3A01_09280 [Bacteroidales bacterium]|nr:hypothetical protein [Bacteroidales bacterium]
MMRSKFNLILFYFLIICLVIINIHCASESTNKIDDREKNVKVDKEVRDIEEEVSNLESLDSLDTGNDIKNRLDSIE